MKEKIKNVSRKSVVEAYQQQIKQAIDVIVSIEGKLSSRKKEYVEILEKNIINAPYVLGYLEWPEVKVKK